MKNIEKYTRTIDAIETYKRFNTWYSFDKWLELEYKEPSPSTLMEAAEAVKNTWYANVDASYRSNLEISIENLADAIEREKAKPIRNCDKYKTVAEASNGFKVMCQGIPRCADCRLKQFNCSIAWLYEEADKEVTE